MVLLIVARRSTTRRRPVLMTRWEKEICPRSGPAVTLVGVDLLRWDLPLR